MAAIAWTRKMWIASAVAIAGFLLPVAHGAPAAKKERKRPPRAPGPVVTQTAVVTLPPKQLGSAIATCPPGTKAVGGGFFGAPGGADQTLVTESRRADPRSWIVSGIRANPLTTTSGTLTASVECRRRAGRIREAVAQATLAAASTAGGVISGSATAICPGPRSKALSGGFASTADKTATLAAIPQESRRVSKGRAWTFGASHGDQIPHQIASYVYCGKQSPRARAATVSLAGDLTTTSAPAGGCAQPRRPFAGGFLASQASLAAGGNIVFVLESRRVGRTWRSTGLHAGATSAGSLSSFLYCG